MSSAATQPETASLQGIAFGATAYSLFAFHDALVKSVITDLPITQIIFIRSIVIVIGCLAVGRGTVLRDLKASSGRHLMLLRAVLTLSAWCLYYTTGRYLQLAEMTTLYYFAPIITLILAVTFLRERITVPRIAAAILGFVGVVVACNPTGLHFDWPELSVLGAAGLWGLAMIVMRSIPKTDSALAQILAINLVHATVMGVVSIFFWQPIEPRVFAIILAFAVLGCLGQLLLVHAARLVPAGVLGTVEYSALVWAFVFGYIGWHEIPAAYVYVGAVLIVAAGVLVAYSERRRRGAIIDTP